MEQTPKPHMAEYVKTKQRLGIFLNIDDMGREIPIGVSKAGLLCPFCKGGESKEKSFSLSRTQRGVLYLCHRATCKASGRRDFEPTLGDELREEIQKRNDEGRENRGYSKPLVPVTDAVLDKIRNKWGLSKGDITKWGIKWATEETHGGAGGRLSIPLKDQDGEMWGYIFRAVDNAPTPKVRMHFINVSKPRLAYFSCPESANLLIVEDAISAIRASSYINTVCLCGTDMSEKKAWDIVKYGAEHVFIALDKDATSKAIDHCVEHAGLLEMKVAMLDGPDIKDMDEIALVEFISEVESLSKIDIYKPSREMKKEG